MKCVGAAVLQVHELEAQQAAVNAELNAIRKAVADDNEEFVIKGVKGVSAAQELISKLFCHFSKVVLCIVNIAVLLKPTMTFHCVDCMSIVM